MDDAGLERAVFRLKPSVAVLEREAACLLVVDARTAPVRLTGPALTLLPILQVGGAFEELLEAGITAAPQVWTAKSTRSMLDFLLARGLLEGSQQLAPPPRQAVLVFRIDPLARTIASRIPRLILQRVVMIWAALSLVVLCADALVGGKAGGVNVIAVLQALLTIPVAVVLHEIAHAVAMRSLGRPADGIYISKTIPPRLFLDTFELYRVKDPLLRGWVYAAGPLSDLCLAGLLAAAAFVVHSDDVREVVRAAAAFAMALAVLNTSLFYRSDGAAMVSSLMNDDFIFDAAICRRDVPHGTGNVPRYLLIAFIHGIIGLALTVACLRASL